MKVRIIRLSKKDAHYPNRKDFIGRTGEFIPMISPDMRKGWKKNWYGGKVIFGKDDCRTFAFVKVEQVE